MQNITIFSLGRNIETLKDVLEKSVFSNKMFYKNSNEIDIMLKNRSLLNLLFFKEFDESFFGTKHEVLLNYEELIATNDLVKFQLVNYIKEAKGVINISCDHGFDNESFLVISNLSKIFEGIIFVDGVMVNSDTRVLLDLEGESETDDFIGTYDLFPMDLDDSNSYLDVLKSIPMEITKYIPMVKIQGRHKTKEEVIKRVMALVFIASYAEGLEKNGTIETVRNFFFSQSRKYNLAGSYTENELNFIFNTKPTKAEIETFVKEYEAANVLFWSLNMTDELTFPPLPIFSHELISKSSKYLNLSEMSERALFKDENYILKNYDINHKVLRSALDNKFSGREIPDMINLDILESREKAFKWITSNLDWDKIWGIVLPLFLYIIIVNIPN